jgi:hypothetical protein
MQAHSSAGLLDLACDLFSRRSIEVENAGAGAFLRQAPGDGGSDAIGGASDKDRTILQAAHAAT